MSELHYRMYWVPGLDSPVVSAVRVVNSDTPGFVSVQHEDGTETLLPLQIWGMYRPMAKLALRRFEGVQREVIAKLRREADEREEMILKAQELIADRILAEGKG